MVLHAGVMCTFGHQVSHLCSLQGSPQLVRMHADSVDSNVVGRCTRVASQRGGMFLNSSRPVSKGISDAGFAGVEVTQMFSMCDTDMVKEVGHDLGVSVVKYGRMSNELERKVAHLYGSMRARPPRLRPCLAPGYRWMCSCGQQGRSDGLQSR